MRKKIKVLHIITKLAVGGSQENTIFTCSMLDKNLYDTSILSGTERDEEGDLISRAEEKKVPLFFLPELVRDINPGKDLMALVKIKRFLQKRRYDIVHTHTSKAGIVGRLAAYLERVPVVIHTVHGWNFSDFINPLQRNFCALCEKIAARFTDKLIVVTTEDIKKGLEAGIGNREKYKLIRSGIDLREFYPRECNVEIKREFGINKEDKVIGTVTRLCPQKNIDDFIEMADIVSKTIPDSKFLIVGDGRERKTLEEKIKQLRLDNRVFITGVRNDVQELLSTFDIFVSTSLWEGLPRAIVEALSCGVPVIANAVDGVREIIKDGVNGYLIPPCDVKMMAERVIRVIKNTDIMNYIRGKAPQDTDGFSVEKMVSSISELYVELLNKHKVLPNLN